MRSPRPLVILLLAALAGPGCVAAQRGQGALEPLPPAGYGSMTQNSLALRIRTDEIEVRLVPLDQRVTRLLAADSYRSLQGLVESRRAAIDSIATRAGISSPGLALVTFFGQQAGIRFDPQTVSLLIRNRFLRPLGIVPFSPRFNSQQLDVREQVTAIYLFEEELPVGDSFSF
ncbi:MAG TPA: hypothetical protein VLD58_10385, partial [Gemmatimonadales bacterium]|nr:hypothetical protein [Gemmatimonadales bacterium]